MLVEVVWTFLFGFMLQLCIISVFLARIEAYSSAGKEVCSMEKNYNNQNKNNQNKNNNQNTNQNNNQNKNQNCNK